MAGRKRDASKAKGAGKAAPEAQVDAAAVARAVDLVAGVVTLTGNQRIVPAMIREGRRDGIARAVRAHDTPALYDWFMGLLSMQGISDRNAWSYIHKHGNATYADVGRRLASTRCACPKLESFASFTGCGYRKDARTCANPQHLRLCPVRQLPLRKGLLNIQAVSLHRWLTDVCGGDLVAWIDSRIEAAKAGDSSAEAPQPEPMGYEDDGGTGEPQVQAGSDGGTKPDSGAGGPHGLAALDPAGEVQAESAATDSRAPEVDVATTEDGGRSRTLPQFQLHLAGVAPWAWQAKASLVSSLSAVEGVSAKLANMSLAALMIGGRPNDPDWVAVASQMVTVDSLIHNMLARTGVLAAFGAEHAYGPRCYGENGCEAVIYTLTAAICTRGAATGPADSYLGPSAAASATVRIWTLSPVAVQKALWRFCTGGVLDFCNANRVGSGLGCNAAVCPVRDHCRRALGLLFSPDEA